MKMAFIDAHREELGIEPICQELAVAPSSYHQHAARLADPGKRSSRARRDDDSVAPARSDAIEPGGGKAARFLRHGGGREEGGEQG